MKEKMFNVLRFIVGPEYGFTGEGNEQWYYTVAIAVNLMLTWWLRPDIALIFTILPIIHYVTVFIFGYNDLFIDNNKNLSFVYLGIHALTLIVAIFVDGKWTLLTCAIVVGAVLLSPDCIGDNIFASNAKHLQLLFNTIILAVFIIIDFMLPINLWIKFVIVLLALVIHPVVDWLQGECVDVNELFSDAIGSILKLK